MPRCEIAVPAGTYRSPGQCTKIRGIKPIQYSGGPVKMCRHHRSMVEGGRPVIKSKRTP